jgi:hypothetical protein
MFSPFYATPEQAIEVSHIEAQMSIDAKGLVEVHSFTSETLSAILESKATDTVYHKVPIFDDSI